MAGQSRSNGVPYLAPIGVRPRPHHAAVLKDRVEMQHLQIQALLDENQRLADCDVALNQDLYEADRELKNLSAIARNVKTHKERQVRDVYETSLKMEAEAHRIKSMSMELSKVRGDIEKLHGDRLALTERLHAMEGDMEKVKPESHRVQLIRADCETLRCEIKRARAAIEEEKKSQVCNLKHREAMEATIASLVPKVVRLRAELVNAEKRARAAAAAAAAAAASSPIVGYSSSYGNPVTGYGGKSYAEPYGFHLVNGRADSVPQYPAAGATRNALLGVHGMNTHP